MSSKRSSREAAPIPPQPTPVSRRACWPRSFRGCRIASRPVFVAATCNNVTVLPPELIRKGRFDELFFVDLPNQAERKQIFSIQLAKRKRNPADFDLEKVAAAAKGYSGAEIDAAVQGGLYAAYSEKKELSTQSLLDALAQTVPLSVTRAEEIATLREWARTRAVPASAQDAGSAR